MTVTGNDTVTNVKNGTATVNPTNYTIVNNIVTIKKEYLATLSTGEKTFKLLTGATTLTVIITITDTTA